MIESSIPPLASHNQNWQICRLATCDDLIRHKAAYRSDWYPENGSWGLKQMGRLFCLDYVLHLNPGTVLEVGAGYDQFFDERLGKTCDYWMIDKVGFYDQEIFNRSLKERENTHFVDGLLGEHLPELPSSYFDLVFSVSVLEHVPPAQIADVCHDMWRVLKPGGFLVHSIDISPGMIKSYARGYIENFQSLGFHFDSPASLEWNTDLSDGANSQLILLEPLQTVYTYYGGRRDDMWDNLKKLPHYWATLLVASRKVA